MPQASLPPAPASVAGDPVDDIFDQIDTSTGEVLGDDAPHALVPVRGPAWQRDDTYAGIAALELSDAQIQVLTAPVSLEEIEIKPDSFGAVYLCHASYRKRLNAAFRPGGWAQRQISPWRFDPDQSILSAEFALYARGTDNKVCYVSKAIGAQEYHGGRNEDGNNKGMSYDDAAQGAESNALMRNCKQLGIAIELWEKRTATALRNSIGVCVYYTKYGSDRAKVAWRRLDDAPIKGETGITPDSPNRDRYQAPARPESSSRSETRTSHRPPPPSQPAAATPSPAVPGEPAWGKDGIITLPQAKRLYALTKKHNISEKAMGDYLRSRHQITSSKQIRKEKYQVICDWVEKGGD